MQIKFSLFILLLILCLPFLVNAQNKSVKSKTQPIKKVAECRSNDVSFRCPKGLKTILDGSNAEGIFLAKHAKENYVVFVIAPKENFDEHSLITEAVKTVLKTFLPKESQEYRWRDTEFINDQTSSKFEVNRQLSVGFNGNELVTVGYRLISIKNKKVFVGSIGTDAEAKGKEAEEFFGLISGSSTPGCFDEIKIIHSITGEKVSDESNPCNITITVENPSPSNL